MHIFNFKSFSEILFVFNGFAWVFSSFFFDLRQRCSQYVSWLQVCKVCVIVQKTSQTLHCSVFMCSTSSILFLSPSQVFFVYFLLFVSVVVIYTVWVPTKHYCMHLHRTIVNQKNITNPILYRKIEMLKITLKWVTKPEQRGILICP